MKNFIVAILMSACFMTSCSEKQEKDESKPSTSESLPPNALIQVAEENVVKAKDKSTTIAIGVLDNVMPLSMSNKDPFLGKHGMYVEIGEEIAKRLNKKFHVYYEQDYFFQRPLRKGLLADNCQIQLGLPSPGKKEKFIRKGKVIATDPYIELGYVLVLPKKSPIKKITDLKGKKVAFLRQSPPVTTLSIVEAKFEPIKDDDQGMAFLNDGKVDAAFIWGARAGYLNKYLYKNKFDIYVTPYKWDVVMGLKIEDEELKNKVNGYIKDMKPLISELKELYGMRFNKNMDIPKNMLPSF